MQGATDSANEFQPGILEVLGNVIYTCMLIWIDDLFVYAKDFKEVLQVLDKIFERLEKFNVKLTLVRSKDQQGWRQI